MATENSKPWGPIRAPVDLDSLARYMTANVPGFKGPFQETGQFGIGMSNPTYYLVDQNGTRYVVRRKPNGKLAFGGFEEAVGHHRGWTTLSFLIPLDGTHRRPPNRP